MEQSKTLLFVLLIMVVLAMTSIVMFESSITALATEGSARTRALNHWPVIAGMSGIAAIGVLVMLGMREGTR